MVHKDRVFAVKEVDTLEELAELLSNYSWTLCTGFKYNGLLFLNDSFSEGGPQEYAVLKQTNPDTGEYVQIESLTVSWCTPEKIIEHIKQALNFKLSFGEPFIPKLDFSQNHRCHLCV